MGGINRGNSWFNVKGREICEKHAAACSVLVPDDCKDWLLFIFFFSIGNSSVGLSVGDISVRCGFS